jgi:nucleoside 2-deoxyribosyltransferase
MIISICSSLDFIPQIKNINDKLQQMGHQVFLPKSAEMVIKGEISLEDLKKESADGAKRIERKIKINAFKGHYDKIAQSDAILVLNYTKKDIENYIGGNTFLEMGFACILAKKIFLFSDVPQMLYTDETKAMQPIVINGNLSLIS